MLNFHFIIFFLSREGDANVDSRQKKSDSAEEEFCTISNSDRINCHYWRNFQFKVSFRERIQSLKPQVFLIDFYCLHISADSFPSTYL